MKSFVRRITVQESIVRGKVNHTNLPIIFLNNYLIHEIIVFRNSIDIPISQTQKNPE